MRNIIVVLIGIGLYLSGWNTLPAAEKNEACFIFACAPNNDLYQVMKDNGLKCLRFDDPVEAVRQAPAGAGLLILAEGYPMFMTAVYGEVLDHLKEKNLRCYLEYSCHLAGLKPGMMKALPRTRAVVTSEAFGPDLAPMRILSINGCVFVPYEGVKKPHIVIAKVAGYDTAVYGLPTEKNACWPILFELDRGDVMAATTKLSNFVQARNGPQAAWQSVWKMVLNWLQPGREIPPLKWAATVNPYYSRDAALPDDAEKLAMDRSFGWFKRVLDMPMHHGLRDRTDRNSPSENGFFEGYSSSIDMAGGQPVSGGQRNDCSGESLMAFATGQKLTQDSLYGRAAANVGDWVYCYSHNTKGPRAHPASPSYGLMGWSNGSPNVYYTDDNARCMLGTIGCTAMLGEHRWDEGLARSLLANFRLSGPNGFQPGRVDEDNLQFNGWRYYHSQPCEIEYSPHYVSWILACYLWGYQQSGYEPFLTQTKKAIQTLVEAYPDRWKWTNGIQQERARLLLPLAWLVRAQDTTQHRAWLMKIAGDLIEDQVACGAIREELGDLKKGSYPPPEKNEDFGNYEAPLIQQNGDPSCDLLYTSNFAFLSLHEAAAATGEPSIRQAEDKLAKYLCRVQIHSEARPEFDGGWYRGFDFDKWEYWGEDADAGWGVWCTESGWTQSWITSVLGLRQMKTSLWELGKQKNVKDIIERQVKVMIPKP
jgi:hypothetical protein